MVEGKGPERPAGELLDLPLGPETGGAAPASASPTADARAPAHGPRELSTRPGGGGDSPPPPSSRTGRSAWPLWLLLLLVPLALGAGYWLRREPPVAVLSMALAEFGEVSLGADPRAVELGLENRGQKVLQVLDAELQGENLSAFALDGADCAGRTLQQGESCTYRLRFEPQHRGAHRAELMVATDAANGTQRLPLQGTGLAPALNQEQPSLDFGSQLQGSGSEPMETWVENSGNAPLVLNRIRFQGPAATDFYPAGDGCSARTLPPGGRCRMGFTFLPSEAGIRRATVVLDSDAPEGPASLELSGVGRALEPVLALDAGGLDFGAEPVGNSTESLMLTLSNPGTGPFQVLSLRLEPATAPFAVLEEDCSGQSLEPEAECTVAVRFAPAAEGEAEARLMIEHDAPQGVDGVDLVGVGTVARGGLSTQRLAFSEVAVGANSRVRRLELNSQGSAPLRLGRVQLQGADARAFSLRTDTCSEVELAVGSNCVLDFSFEPLRDGPHRAQLDIPGLADGKVTLSGIGISPRPVLEPAALDFGSVVLGQDRGRRVTLKNEGRAPLAVAELHLESGARQAFELDSDGCSGGTLGAGQSCELSVRFTPRSEGLAQGRVLIRQGGRGSLNLDLRGQGLPRPEPLARLSPRRLDFSDLRVGERSSIYTLTVENPGTGQLELRVLEIEGEHAGDFRQVPGSCAAFLAAGSSCTLGLRFTPLDAGPRRAVLRLRHNAKGGDLTVELVGQGTRDAPPVGVPGTTNSSPSSGGN